MAEVVDVLVDNHPIIDRMAGAHPNRAVAPDPFVKFVQVELQLTSPLVDIEGCMSAVQRALSPSHLRFPNLMRATSSAGHPERILFAVASQGVAVAVAESGLFIDTIRYGSWDEFRGTVERVLEAIEPFLSAEIAYARLHYLDEIRIDGADGSPRVFQPFVRFPVIPADPDFAVHVERAYGGFRLQSDGQPVSLEWTITNQPALNEQHPLFSEYDPTNDFVLAMDWEARVDDATTLAALDRAYEAVSAMFWDTLTPEGRSLMGMGG